MAEQSLIFFDVDGTLLDASGNIPPSARKAIALAQENNHLCFVNTGRPYAHLVPSVRSLPFDGYICSCGQHILLKDRTLLHEGFSQEESREIVALVRACDLDVVYEGEQGVWFDHCRPHCPEILDSMAHFSALGFDVYRSIDSEDFSFDKFCVWVQPDSDASGFLEKIRLYCTVVEREGNLLELVRLGYSKETGMQAVINHSGIPREHTYALGDSTNDLPMLRFAAHSIAMENAPDEVKVLAEHVTPPAEQDGVAAALEHYHLIDLSENTPT